jgi:FkbM family methyltransferase
MRSRSYSQFWEDRLIARYVAHGKGSYVDIGAGSPIWGSNTYYFYRRGWSGVTVDPISTNMHLQKLLRPRDRHYQSIISSDLEKIEFFQFTPWELSTTNEKCAKERISGGATLVTQMILQPISLETIYNENPIKNPSFLSIDVEGAEMKVLQSNNWNLYKPDIICVEELESPLSQSDVREYLSQQNYDLVVYNGVSSIYQLQRSKRSA